MKEFVIALALIFQLSGIAHAQAVPSAQRPKPEDQKPSEPPPQNPVRHEEDEIVRITTNLVQVDPVITDSKGKPVTDLKPEEIQILEDGKPQQITNFSFVSLDPPVAAKVGKPDKNAPPTPPLRLRPEQARRIIALVVDDLGLSFESTYYVREALKKFLDQQMQPNDVVAIIRTSAGIGALQQFTTDKRQLYAALERVRWYPNGRSGVAAFAPISGDPTSTFGNAPTGSTNEDLDQFRTDIYTVGTLGAVNYILRGLRNLPGRKSIVLMSEGFASFSSSEPTGNMRIFGALQSLVDMANRASVVVHTLDPRGLPTLNLTAADSTGGLDMSAVAQALSARRADFIDSQMSMRSLSGQTGGVSIQNHNDLTGALKKVIEDQGGYYLIGYRPDDSTFDEVSGKHKFHQLSLKVLRPGKFNVRMRKGFYGITDEDAKPTVVGKNRMVNALVSPFETSEIQTRLTSLFANDAKLGSILRSLLHVNASNLTFKEEPDGSHTSVFDIMAFTFGDNGVVVDHMSRQHTIRVKGQTYERILKEGFTYYLTVPVAKPGAYQLRTALRDPASGRVGSASQFIEVPDIKKKRLMLSGLVLNGVSQNVFLKGEEGAAKPQDISDNTVGANDPKVSPAVREFNSGMVMIYGYQIYNAKLDKATEKPRLVTRVRLFRNGEEVFRGQEIPFDATDQNDLKRLAAAGAIQLGAAMVPGEYVLQIIVTDLVATDKHRIASQWIDFDVVK